jgi:hypothetical protein
MSLVQSARLHGHDPWAYLKDVLTPTHRNSRTDKLLEQLANQALTCQRAPTLRQRGTASRLHNTSNTKTVRQ